jgi:MFS family permease
MDHSSRHTRSTDSRRGLSVDLQKPPTQRDTDPEAFTRLETSQSQTLPPKSLSQKIPFVAVVCIAQFMTQAGLSMSIAPVHIIGLSFGTSNPAELSWFAAAYSLTVGTFILVAGRLGDVYGHRRLFVLGFGCFSLWSLLAGFSVWSNKIFFDCCWALQGIGPAILLPNAIAIFGRTYPPGFRKEMIFVWRHCPRRIYSRWCVFIYLCPVCLVALGILGDGNGLYSTGNRRVAHYSSYSATQFQ